MENFRSSLLNHLNKHSAHIDLSYLAHSTLWNICYDTSSLTFIDIIKGIVPEFLSKKIHQITRDKESVLDILYIIYGELYVNIKTFIWISCCDSMLQKEIGADIT